MRKNTYDCGPDTYDYRRTQKKPTRYGRQRTGHVYTRTRTLTYTDTYIVEDTKTETYTEIDIRGHGHGRGHCRRQQDGHRYGHGYGHGNGHGHRHTRTRTIHDDYISSKIVSKKFQYYVLILSRWHWSEKSVSVRIREALVNYPCQIYTDTNEIVSVSVNENRFSTDHSRTSIDVHGWTHKDGYGIQIISVSAFRHWTHFFNWYHQRCGYFLEWFEIKMKINKRRKKLNYISERTRWFPYPLSNVWEDIFRKVINYKVGGKIHLFLFREWKYVFIENNLLICQLPMTFFRLIFKSFYSYLGSLGYKHLRDMQ